MLGCGGQGFPQPQLFDRRINDSFPSLSDNLPQSPLSNLELDLVYPEANELSSHCER